MGPFQHPGTLFSFSLIVIGSGWVLLFETEHLNEIPSELANELDPRLRFMLGFGTHGALGGYDPRHRKVPRAMAKMSKL